MNSRAVFLTVTVLVTVVLVVGCGAKGSSNDGSGSSGFPSAPLNVSATEGKFITLDWDTVPGLCYNLYWNTSGGLTTSDNRIEDVLPPYVHSGLLYDGTTYYYAVTALDCRELTESELSAEVSAVPQIPDNEFAKLTASDAGNEDYFGIDVSLSGDYAIVGSYSEDGDGTDRGAAYIYYRDQGGADNWGEVKKLTASDAEDDDWFGGSVAISGDYAVVGSFREDGAGYDRGAAYVFYRNQGGADNWGEVRKLTASDAENEDNFGGSVSISGDYVIAGAHWEDGSDFDLGAAYVFYRNEGGVDNWGEVKKLTASDAERGAWFGDSVSIKGDYAMIGSGYKNSGLTAQGAAYVFYRNQGGADNWGEVKKLTASDAQANDRFGVSVSIDGEYAVVGANDVINYLSQRGAAYVFSRNQGGAENWGEVKRITPSDAGSEDDKFGCSVSLSGDYTVVGAQYKDVLKGAAYVFYRNQGGTDNWGEVKMLTASDAQNIDFFGISVSMSGDTIISGAMLKNGVATEQGAAYIYVLF